MKYIYLGIKFLGAISIIALFGVGCVKITVAPTNTAVKNINVENGNINSAPAAADISDVTLKNAGYQFGGEYGLNKVKLVDGYFESGTYPYNGFVRMDNNIGRGDINGDEVDDAIVVLLVNQGGTGTWPVIFAILNENGKAVSYKSGGFEDRTVINSIVIKDTIVNFDLTVHGPADPMCCPTAHKTELYRWYGYENRLELLGSPDPAAVKANTDFSKYLPITTKIEHFNGMNHAADETDVYRNGVLMFTIQPGFPIGGTEGNTDYGYDWNVFFTPVINGNIKSALNIKPTKITINSKEAPKFELIEVMNKERFDRIELTTGVGGTDIAYDIATRTFAWVI